MTQLLESKSDRVSADAGRDGGRDADFGAQNRTGSEKIADRIRDRSERIRRRELEIALGRLRASGEVTPEESRAIALLSARLTDALVERWTRKLAEDGVDSQVALELLAGER